MKRASLLWDEGSRAYCLDFRGEDLTQEDIDTVKQHLPVETHLSSGWFHRFVLDSTFDASNKKQFVFARIILDAKFRDEAEIEREAREVIKQENLKLDSWTENLPGLIKRMEALDV